MSLRRSMLLTITLLLAGANPASADNDRNPHAVTNASSKGLDQIVYKGVVGNALDEIPMDPSKRVSLQRTNAIVSNALSGHTLTTLVGLSNPVLLIGGLVWGVWAASNIKAEDASVRLPAPEPTLALLRGSLATHTTDARPLAEMEGGASRAPDAEDAAPLRAPVVKIWLPQRSVGAQ